MEPSATVVAVNESDCSNHLALVERNIALLEIQLTFQLRSSGVARSDGQNDPEIFATESSLKALRRLQRVLSSAVSEQQLSVKSEQSSDALGPPADR